METPVMAALAPRVLNAPLSKLRDALAAHYRRLGAASRRLRFLAPLEPRDTDRLARAATPQLVLGIEADGSTRGVLELFATRMPGHAEIGISVEDKYQGRGFGRALFRRGLEEARAAGFDTVEVFFSHQNRAIRKLCREAGGEIEVLGGDILARIDLRTAAPLKPAA